MEAFIYFALFFVPSFLVFLYKAISWSGSSKGRGFLYFLYSEYISIVIILLIFGGTLIFTSYFLGVSDEETSEKTERYYKKFDNYKGLEDLYTEKIISDSTNLDYVYSKIYYHFKQEKRIYNDEGEVSKKNDFGK